MADNNTQNQDINGLLQIRRDKLADLVEKGKILLKSPNMTLHITHQM